jgi:methylated-DNA-[protein]-cysteine S-methyltransferase
MSADLRFARVDTPLGPMLLATTPLGVAALSRDGVLAAFLAALQRRFPDSEPLPDARAVRPQSSRLRAYLAGIVRELPPVDLAGLARWDARVFLAVRAIPYGRTATYGEIAAMVGSPGAARAVGGALSRCPLFPAVPCHRVVMARDGVSGWGGGDIAVKRRLLDLERGR